MAFHQWGDDFDWGGLNEAIIYIAKNLKRWGRVSVRDYKEKWGSARIYCSLGWYSIHDIIFPGYCFSRFPKWLWTFDCYCGSKIVPFLFNWFVYPYHCWLYRKLYSNAVKKWPHLKEEILCAADYHKLLEGI